MEDMHRGKCFYREPIAADPKEWTWLELLDWAVYHGPGWELWQEFRQSLLTMPMPTRAAVIREWWQASLLSGNEEEQLADIVRCTNILRSLRGQFSTYPVLPELLASLNRELEARWRVARAS